VGQCSFGQNSIIGYDVTTSAMPIIGGSSVLQSAGKHASVVFGPFVLVPDVSGGATLSRTY